MKSKGLILLVGLVSVTPAFAQDLASIYSSSVFQQGVIGMGKPTLEAGQKAYASSASRSDLDALEFDTSSSVERATRQKLLDALLPSSGDPRVQASLRKSIESDAVWESFDNVLGHFGYSSDNLADVTTAYYVMTWEVVNNEDAARYPSGIRAAHQAIESAMATNPEVQSLSDAEKQEACEIMAYMATVAGAAKNELRDSGDTTRLAQLQASIHQSVLRQGVDLRRLRLTDNGFVNY
ncbi:hypothetical protein RM530_16370 [Algiphilus sp. W345]|uniref:Uncharacterized protein n=1 Tax=Banduia mediterranea TaxID=3075609 RepID=A0ABU2WM14_9GAMM|nr:DUF6683 family protein [Algiphilus sp. W345]MDT0498921.1 hypothetical protein [Algiphilus sp. W345]